ncbi:hypothetical protein [Candidatus Entotheonella palauensis]|uniref:Addiction module protein n=1 Tax=Candidatus Entotheonella gemina TaxID=1429439 RepID=W4M0I1_9BACT|nr:hypothetical protein [Candidatus Entotheonella palauensis]ETX03491.1 MAG: hypothetical protein ETSY2_33310 [Candidatus Entotheonella gemina]
MASQPAVTLQDALEVVEALPETLQEDLIRILQHRHEERCRDVLAEHIQTARAEYNRGEVRRGTVDDLMKEISE